MAAGQSLPTSTISGAISGVFQSNAMQSFIDNDVLGWNTDYIPGEQAWKAYSGPFQGVISNVVGAGISGVAKDAANGNAGWKGIGWDVVTNIVASGAGQLGHNEIGNFWSESSVSVAKPFVSNFSSGLIQQGFTSLGTNITDLRNTHTFSNVSDGTGGTVWPDALGNGIGGSFSDWLLPWP
jgi:hypothetical protein